MSCRYLETWNLTILVFLAWYSKPVLADGGDDFLNNLLSDLGPLIALFGEKVTIQYLSQSMHWLEHVIFACGPLGMITAITCAIRVAGHKRLGAIIGRARESGAQAEIEVMSSTSTDVCELWNGVGIVRVAGSPDVVELLYDRASAGSNQGGPTKGVYKRTDILEDSAYERGNHSPLQDLLRESLRQWFAILWIPQPDTESGREIGAPNISLNTSNPAAPMGELCIIAFVGVLFQGGALVLAGFATYEFRWKKGGKDISTWAFPLTLIGSLSVVVGMFICAYVIECSTIERVWKVKNQVGERNLQILWLQRGQTVNDQMFKSFAIYAAKDQKTITTSQPLRGRVEKYHVLTTGGTFLSVIGFILQFVGLRQMHFSATLAQLVAMGVMTFLRVFLRRNLTTDPKRYGPDPTVIPTGTDDRYSVKELPEGHELDFIAKQVTQCNSWEVVTVNKPQEQDSSEAVQRVLQARIRLGEVAGKTWRTELHTTNIRLLNETMEAVLNHLCSPTGCGISPGNLINNQESFKWPLRASTTTVGSPPQSGIVWLEINRVKTGDDFGPWKVVKSEEAKLEAIFSLWMSHLSRSLNSDEDDNLWIIDTGSPAADGDVGRILCDWWISREIDCIDVPNIQEICARRRISKFRTLHCMDIPSTNGTLLGIVNNSTLPRMCAQFILSKFIIAIARSVDPITSEIKVKRAPNRRVLKLFNRDINDIAKIFERSGLATLDDAYRIVVPALFEADTLPNVLDKASDILKISIRFEKEGRPADAKDLCTRIRNICIYRASVLTRRIDSPPTPTPTETTKLAKLSCSDARMECMRLIKAFMTELGPTHLETVKMRQSMGGFGAELAKDIVPVHTDPVTRASLSDLRTPLEFPLHIAVGGRKIQLLYTTLIGGQVHGIDRRSTSGETPLTLAVMQLDRGLVTVLLSFGADASAYDSKGKTALHLLPTSVTSSKSETKHILDLLLHGGANINDQQNPQNETPLHVAATVGHKDMVDLLLKNGALLNVKDKSNQTALHKAAEKGHEVIVKMLINQSADPHAKDKDGATALHKAAKGGYTKLVQYLISKGSDPGRRDNIGRTAIHVAAGEGHTDTVNSLIELKDSKDKLGMTAFHKAAVSGHQAILELLMGDGCDPDVKDKDGNTALQLAVQNKHVNAVEYLLKSGASADTKDKSGGTSLHRAAEKGLGSILKLLLDNGCDPDVKDKTGRTAFHAAASNGDKTTMALLVVSGANPDAKDNHGRTSLHKAAEQGRQDIVRLLLDNGHNPHAQDNDGHTAIHLAKTNRHEATIKFFEKHCAALNDID